MPTLVLSDDEVQQLRGIASSRSLLHSIVQRAQIVLACGAGETNTSIAKRMGLTGMTVGKWRQRYRELGLEGLHDELRPGRPRTYAVDTVGFPRFFGQSLRPSSRTSYGLFEPVLRTRWG